jgi:hypothetical protein
MRRLFISLICSCTIVFFIAYAAEIPIEPTGPYKTIDVRLANDTIKSLQNSKGEKRLQIIQKVTSESENFAPPVLYFVSSLLFEQGKKDDAMFWFYAGQLRGRIDANICADKSAQAAISALNERFGTPINQYSFRDIPKLTNTVNRVLAWEEKTSCAYDRRWINLHGMNGITGDTNSALSAPKEQWETIRKSTRDDYRSTFYEALVEFNKMKKSK